MKGSQGNKALQVISPGHISSFVEEGSGVLERVAKEIFCGNCHKIPIIRDNEVHITIFTKLMSPTKRICRAN